MSDKENKPKRGTVPTAAPSYGPNPAPVATVVQYPTVAHQNPYEIHQGGYPRGALGVSPGLHAPPPFLPPPTYPPLWPMGDTRGIHTRMMHPDSRAYTSNLFDCFDDLPTCLGGTFCTPCQVGRAASDAKAGDCCATGWIILGLSQLNQLLPGLGNVASGGYLAHIANRAASIGTGGSAPSRPARPGYQREAAFAPVEVIGRFASNGRGVENRPSLGARRRVARGARRLVRDD